MKLTLIQDLAVPETEITIRCAGIDARLQRLIDISVNTAFHNRLSG